MIDLTWNEFYNLDDYLNYYGEDDNSKERARTWLFIVYPDFCVENWKELLDRLHLQYCVSPLHHGIRDADYERLDHYHVYLVFNGMMSLSQVQHISDLTHVNGTGVRPLRCKSPAGALRYFLHIDNPEKEQFVDCPDQYLDFLECHGGLVLNEEFFIGNIKGNVDYYVAQMIDWCRLNHVCEFAMLLEYSKKYKYNTWFHYLNHYCKSVMIDFLKSFRHGTNENYQYYNSDGEIVILEDLKELSENDK